MRRAPAKFSFSARYSLYGICGALVLSDQGSPKEPDMVQMGATKWRGSDGRVGGGDME